MTNDERAYDLHRRALAAVTALHGAFSGVTPLEAAPAEMLRAAGATGYSADDIGLGELLVPLAAIALQLARLLGEASGRSVEEVLQMLGGEAASFDG